MSSSGSNAPLAVVILAAGQGTRMKSDLPKVLHPVAGRPMIRHVLAVAESLEPVKIVTVVAPGMERVAEAVTPHPTAIQSPALGTAHALLQAEAALRDEVAAGADVLVLYGDGPLITAETLQIMLGARRDPAGPAFVWLGVRPPDPFGYGRLVVEEGRLQRIVEEKDASPEEKAIGLVWGGLLVGKGDALFRLAGQIGNDNAKGEYYLTDLVALGNAAAAPSGIAESGFDDVRGVNSRAELAAAEAIMQQRLRAKWLAEGVTMQAPETVFLAHDTELARDVTIEPNVFFGPKVTVGPRVVIRAFSHLEDCRIAADAVIGPYARLRPGAEIGEAAHVGNFVEVKAAKLGHGAKANHLTYIGDAEVGAKANIGAGTITANYNGIYKSKTVIGPESNIGSNSVLVAPVTIGDKAVVGAGSTITKDVPANAIAATRSEMSLREEAAERYRERLRAEKAERDAKKES